MKKIFSALLTAVMVAGLIPAGALAEEEPLPEQPEQAEAQPEQAAQPDGQSEEFEIIEPEQLMTDLEKTIPEGLFSIRQTSEEQYVRSGSSFTFVLEVDNDKIQADLPAGSSAVPGVANLDFKIVMKDEDDYSLSVEELTNLIEITSVDIVSGSPIDGKGSSSFSSDTMKGSVYSSTPITSSGKSDYLAFTLTVLSDASVNTGLNQDYHVALEISTVDFIIKEGDDPQVTYSYKKDGESDSVETNSFLITPETENFRLNASLTTAKEFVSAHETFTVALSLPQGTSYESMEGYLTFDSNLLALNDYEWGSFTNADIVPVVNTDQNRFGFTMKDGESRTAGTDPILLLTFYAKNAVDNVSELNIVWNHTSFYPSLPSGGNSRELARRVIASPLRLGVDHSTVLMESDVNFTILTVDDSLKVTLTIPSGFGVSEITGTVGFDADVLECTDAAFGWSAAGLTTSFNKTTGALDVHTASGYYAIPEDTELVTLTFKFKTDAISYDAEGSTQITWTKTTFENNTTGTAEKTDLVLTPITLPIMRICIGDINYDFETVEDVLKPVIDMRDFNLLRGFILASSDEKNNALINHKLTMNGVQVPFYNINACVTGGDWTEGRMPDTADQQNLYAYLMGDESAIATKYDNIG